MAYVYILESQRDKRYYIGSAVDLKSRLRHHRGGFTHSTRRFGELKLVFNQEYTSLSEARGIERKLKKLKRKDYIEKIIKDGFITLRP